MENHIYISLLIGVISGLVTYALTLFISIFYYKIIRPWYASFLYRGVTLDGTWRCKYQGNAKIDMLLNLSQHAYDIEGTFYAETTRADNTKYSNQYNVNGIIKDNNLLLQYQAMSSRRIGVGSFVLVVRQGGNSLSGDVIYINESGSEVLHIKNLIFERD